MKQLVSVKVASAVIAGLGLTTGLVGVVGASTGSIAGTGNDSENYVTATSATDNMSAVNVNNENNQAALSGDAVIEDNDDEAGTATTGAAENVGDQMVSGGINYGGTGADNATDDTTGTANGSSAVIEGPTGDDSVNTVEAHSDYTTTTNLNVQNTNNQAAVSGNAYVAGNENAGAATTGTVKNESKQSTTFNVNY